MENKLIKILKDYYSFEITKIEKNEESSVGNVYIIYTKENKYVLKLYDDIKHVNSMIKLHLYLSGEFHIPKIIQDKNTMGYVKIAIDKYIVVYSFLEGIQLYKMIDNINEDTVKNIALELRKLHEFTNDNNFILNSVPFLKNSNNLRKSLLHFDLTKGNIFYNDGKIGFIDFDDAKYGPSICDVSILVALLFISKKRGFDKKNIKIFIDSYYGNDEKLKFQETKYIKEIAIKWIDYTLKNNEFNLSTNESFEIKKKLIEDNFLDL